MRSILYAIALRGDRIGVWLVRDIPVPISPVGWRQRIYWALRCFAQAIHG